ncbi:MAG: hypothetical protein KAI40_03745 [Desulfobacterales bacterium]|nr:hypothetical protein [Desulfobacterales bacterium]
MNEIAGIGKSYRRKLSRVLERNFGVITARLVSETLDVSTQESGRLLSRWCKNGWLLRIKRGAYIPIPIDSTSNKIILEEPFLIAEMVYGPGYVAGFSAAKHWDFSEQIIETITYFTCKKVKDRNPSHGGIKFKLKTINRRKVFGLKTLWIANKKIKISDPSKTMVDLLDDPKLVGGMSIVGDFFSEYFDSKYYDIELLIKYAKGMNNKTIFKRLGLLFEIKFNVSDEILSIILDNISTGLSKFDLTTPSDCIITKWQLKASKFWKKEYDRKK